MCEEVFTAVIRSDEAETLESLNHLTVPSAMFATFLQKRTNFPGLPDSLFALNDPVLVAIPMQLEAKHYGFLRELKYVVNKFQ